MIMNDDELMLAKDAVKNLEEILEKSRKVSSSKEYRAMSEPILLELQQRETEILQYLSVAEKEFAMAA